MLSPRAGRGDNGVLFRQQIPQRARPHPVLTQTGQHIGHIVQVLLVRADEVIIGEQYPLSGPMAAFSGPFLKQGAEMAVERINKDQMIGPGRTLKLVIEDNAGDRNQAISLMSKFANTPGLVAIHGHLFAD